MNPAAKHRLTLALVAVGRMETEGAALLLVLLWKFAVASVL